MNTMQYGPPDRVYRRGFVSFDQPIVLTWSRHTGGRYQIAALDEATIQMMVAIDLAVWGEPLAPDELIVIHVPVMGPYEPGRHSA